MSDASEWEEGLQGNFPVHKAVIEGESASRTSGLAIGCANIELRPQPCLKARNFLRQRLVVYLHGRRPPKSQSYRQITGERDIS
jgi:hypothetical protein